MSLLLFSSRSTRERSTKHSTVFVLVLSVWGASIGVVHASSNEETTRAWIAAGHDIVNAHGAIYTYACLRGATPLHVLAAQLIQSGSLLKGASQ